MTFLGPHLSPRPVMIIGPKHFGKGRYVACGLSHESARRRMSAPFEGAHSPWAMTSLSGFQASAVSSARRALARWMNEARHSRGVLPPTPTSPSSRISQPFQPVWWTASWRWMRSHTRQVEDAR